MGRVLSTDETCAGCGSTVEAHDSGASVTLHCPDCGKTTDELDRLDLDHNAANALRRAGITTIEQARQVTGPHQVRWVGVTYYNRLRAALEKEPASSPSSKDA